MSSAEVAFTPPTEDDLLHTSDLYEYSPFSLSKDMVEFNEVEQIRAIVIVPFFMKKDKGKWKLSGHLKNRVKTASFHYYGNPEQTVFIASGGYAYAKNRPASEVICNYLAFKMWIPPHLIFQEPYSFNTLESLLFTRDLLRKLNSIEYQQTKREKFHIGRVTFVISEYHRKRIQKILDHFYQDEFNIDFLCAPVGTEDATNIIRRETHMVQHLDMQLQHYDCWPLSTAEMLRRRKWVEPREDDNLEELLEIAIEVEQLDFVENLIELGVKIKPELISGLKTDSNSSNTCKIMKLLMKQMVKES